MDRMGMTDEECRFLDEDHVAIHFKGVYDRFTEYIRTKGITTEHLQYNQFMKQLRKSDLFVEMKAIRMGSGDLKKAAVLDYAEMKKRCDVDGFIRSQIVPLA